MGILRIELGRAFLNRWFAAALGLASAIVVAHVAFSIMPAAAEQQMYVEGVGFPLSVFNRWIGGWPGTVFPTLYFFILPLLVCLPFSATLYSDTRTGYDGQVATRVSRRRYYYSKAAAAFLSGMAVAVVPLVLDFYLTALFLPLVMPEPASGLFPIFPYSTWSDIYYTNAFLYTGMFLALIAGASGLIACVPLLFSRLLGNGVLVLCSSLFLDTIANYLIGSTDLKFLVPSVFMRPDQPYYGFDGIQVALFVCGLAALELVALYRMAKRHETC
ncbi:MAG: hypothetical protein LBG81_09055 [Coriobacteriaceae bacterium]|jgi:hypothetical protein|nr:hypothetical protein [Coriobacteriaceae bacterium]